MTTLEPLARLLSSHADQTIPRITVDLRRADFLDSSGLSVLVQASKHLRSTEVPRAPRVVVTPGRQPERILHLGSFGKILEITHDLGSESSD